MTDAVKTTEVEDVLASIRRLVSANPLGKSDRQSLDGSAGHTTRAGNPGATEPALDDDALPEKNKLVLTPADRVAAQPSAGDEADEPSEPQPVVSAKASALPEVESLAKRLLGSDEARLRDLVVSEIRGALSTMDPEEDVSPAETEASATQPQSLSDQPHAPASVERPAEPSARSVLRLVSPVPPEQVVQPKETMPIEPDVNDTEVGSEATVEQTLPVSPLLMSLYPTNDGDKPSKSLEQKIAELEALIARSNAQFEPEQEGQGENAATSQPEVARMPWDDAALLADVTGDQVADIPHDASDPSDEPAPMAEDVALDEDLPLPFLPPAAGLRNKTQPDDAPEATFVTRRKPVHEVAEDTGEDVPDVAMTAPVETTAPLVLEHPEIPAADLSDPGETDNAVTAEVADHVADGPTVEQPTDEAPQDVATPPQDVATPPRDSHLQVVPTPDPSAEMVISEDELRDLVARMIREELQGVMGERITRNVRKLVRREIQRALANHDLD